MAAVRRPHPLVASLPIPAATRSPSQPLSNAPLPPFAPFGSGEGFLGSGCGWLAGNVVRRKGRVESLSTLFVPWFSRSHSIEYSSSFPCLDIQTERKKPIFTDLTAESSGSPKTKDAALNNNMRQSKGNQTH
ncbi:predicted protein [Histoplasma mississippiense (nom. inval.)]|uniref:predicted protein n=1 Tax=Ajellomyces capsulatus (strain NAm1 / WU24) TaxID=2059318 RepID=UPI000157CA4E|nr:predicted protein [Histoplasma mississippiense (nom. inval.)]EDN09512.1 predicted protein [Histoplasma mississippiense (nom. inval.)]